MVPTSVHRAARIGALVAFVGAASCGRLATIGLDYAGATTVPAATVVETLLGGLGFDDLVALDIAASQEIADAGAEPGDIVSVVLTEFSLSATSPDGAELGFIERLDVFVTAPDAPRVRVAYGEAFAGKTRVTLELDDVDLVDHVVAGPLTVDLEVEGRRPEQATTVEAVVALDVGVTLQGACRAVSTDAGGAA